MEVDQRLGSNLSLDVVLCASLLHLLRSSVEGSNVGVVVLGVVEFHDLAADGGLESAVVIWKGLVRQRAIGSEGG